VRRLPLTGHEVAEFGSRGVTASQLARVGAVEGAAVDVLSYEPGAWLGRHPTRLWQLFAVVAGEGWVAGADGVRAELVAGEGVIWEPGEEHESGTARGMVALVVQTPVPPLPDITSSRMT
jgi:quercetin dioxygenase-like cupin family protein